jgi:hypothetical protein
MNTRIKIIAFLVGIPIIIIGTILIILSFSDVDYEKEDLRDSAILFSHQFIKERLITPEKAVFQDVKEAKYYTDDQPYQKYHFVVSHFDAKAENGTRIRTHYKMELQKTRTVWIMLDLDTW